MCLIYVLELYYTIGFKLLILTLSLESVTTLDTPLGLSLVYKESEVQCLKL
jgi:hypothetical protein